MFAPQEKSQCVSSLTKQSKIHRLRETTENMSISPLIPVKALSNVLEFWRCSPAKSEVNLPPGGCRYVNLPKLCFQIRCRHWEFPVVASDWSIWVNTGKTPFLNFSLDPKNKIKWNLTTQSLIFIPEKLSLSQAFYNLAYRSLNWSALGWEVQYR